MTWTHRIRHPFLWAGAALAALALLAIAAPGASAASASDPTGDALAPDTDFTELEASHDAANVYVNMALVGIDAEGWVEDVVEYQFTINGQLFGVCNSTPLTGAVPAAPFVWDYDNGAEVTSASAAYDFATAEVSVEIPIAALDTGTMPATVWAESTFGPCDTGGLEPDDRVPDSGDVSTGTGAAPPPPPPPPPPSPTTTWYMHRGDPAGTDPDPYFDGAILDFNAPAASEVDQTATSEFQVEEAQIVADEQSGAAQTLCRGSGGVDEATFYLKTWNNGAQMVDVEVDVLAAGSSIATGSTQQLMEPVNGDHDPAGTYEFVVDLNVTGTQIAAGEALTWEVSWTNPDGMTNTPLVYARGISQDHTWSLELDFHAAACTGGPEPDPDLFNITAPAEGDTVPAGLTLAGTADRGGDPPSNSNATWNESVEVYLGGAATPEASTPLDTRAPDNFTAWSVALTGLPAGPLQIRADWVDDNGTLLGQDWVNVTVEASDDDDGGEVGGPGPDDPRSGTDREVAERDSDGDGVQDHVDNCPSVANKGQDDLDRDGEGDACDRDLDGDGVVGRVDNCPSAHNPSQRDTDGDGVGDACDSDSDGDGVADVRDNCPWIANDGQEDRDNDGVGDRCDDDVDGDGLLDAEDPDPLNKSSSEESEGEAEKAGGDEKVDALSDVGAPDAHRTWFWWALGAVVLVASVAAYAFVSAGRRGP